MKIDGPIFWLVSLIMCGAVVYVNWLFIRDRPTDRSAIDNFAEQRGLRMISVRRSYYFFGYWFRGINADGAVRFYRLTAADAQGNRGDILVAFDSLFGPGQLLTLELQGLSSPGGSAGAMKPSFDMMRLNRYLYELLFLCVAGACLGGGFFCFILYANLSPPNRPVLPEPALGYTHFFKAKYGYVYGTFFEYLAVVYGVLTMSIASILSGLFVMIELKARISPRWQVFASAAISMALCHAIWRLSTYTARS